MRYDADPRRGGLVFRKRKRQTGALVLDAIAIGHGCHFSRCSAVGRLNRVAGKIKKGGVSIVGEAGPRRGRQDPCHQECCSRSAARMWTSASIRGVHPLVHRRTACAFAPHTPERVAHTSVGATFRATRVGPVRPPPDRHARSHMQHRLRHPRVWRIRGQRKDRQVLGQVVPLAAAPSWFIVLYRFWSRGL